MKEKTLILTRQCVKYHVRYRSGQQKAKYRYRIRYETIQNAANLGKGRNSYWTDIEDKNVGKASIQAEQPEQVGF
uniref:Transposase n=1 Tax=Syphacia muris TaxID=451379 RepID=A0A0N5AJP9_9BILA